METVTYTTVAVTGPDLGINLVISDSKGRGRHRGEKTCAKVKMSKGGPSMTPLASLCVRST